MVNFKEIYHFSRFQRVSNIFEGGPTFSRGSNCLFSTETHIACDFPGVGGVRTPVSPPLDPHLKIVVEAYRNFRFFIKRIQKRKESVAPSPRS